MRLMILLLMGVVAALPAEDPWARVRELKTGSELRIFRNGSVQPVLAKMGELTDENLVIILKDTQTAIPRDEIERIDARPEQRGSRIKKESKTTTTMSDGREGSAGRPGSHAGPSTSTSTGINIGSKPDFETIYRTKAPAPAKQVRE